MEYRAEYYQSDVSYCTENLQFELSQGVLFLSFSLSQSLSLFFFSFFFSPAKHIEGYWKETE